MYLQLHGESETNVHKLFTCRRLDPDLTDNGRQQIMATVTFYRDAGIRGIISSPARRAVQSAEILGLALGLGVTTDDALLEVDLGDLEGQSERDPDRLRIFFDTLRDWLNGARGTRFPGGESGQEVVARIQRLMSAASPASLLVGHATFFAVLMGNTGMSYRRIEDLFLPRGGAARRSKEQTSWEIVGTTEPAGSVVSPKRPDAMKGNVGRETT